MLLRAPVSGKVLKIMRESADPVALGEALLEIGDSYRLEVEIDLLSADAVRLRPGLRVVFTHWGGEGELRGLVKRIELRAFTKVSALGVEEQRVWVIVDFTEAPEKFAGLGDAYRVQADFILWRGERVLQVPGSALFRVGEDWALFVIERDRVRRQIVGIGRRGDFNVELVSGLAAGALVVNHPADELDEGRKVRLFRVRGKSFLRW
ncbi:MAG TPA: HlyD family efflux transporter periplasmic adaptor subunit [Proteobacteria bacterium]|nr:HlyD family efflux transporter periplasmic adaptor subunit [Pseudomonadota bacterium]